MHSVIKHRTTLAAAFPVAVVACIAAVVSYGHIETLALQNRQTLTAARLLPFSVDFLIVAGSVLLLVGYALGWLGVVFGVAGTLFANVESGVAYGALAAAISAWPAVAFTVASFMLERWLRHRARMAVNRDVQNDVQEDMADLVAEAEAVLAAQPARPEPVAAPEPELPPLPAPEPAVELSAPIFEEMTQPTEMTGWRDAHDGRMAKDVVNEWSARGELHKLWDTVDNLSERALAIKFSLRTRNQGVRLKTLRKAAAEAAG